MGVPEEALNPTTWNSQLTTAFLDSRFPTSVNSALRYGGRNAFVCASKEGLMSARALRVVVVFASLLVGGSVFAQGADEEQFKTLFREGVEAFKRGNPEEAYLKLEQALRIK